MSTREQTDAGAAVAIEPNPCEVDIDFGDVQVGQTVVVALEIVNTGPVSLDLATLDAGRSGDFALLYDPTDPIPPASVNAFSVSFGPTDYGQEGATFVIETDGENPECPGEGSQISVVVGGTGAGSK